MSQQTPQQLRRNRLYTLYFLTILSIIAALVFSWVQFRNATEPYYWVDALDYLSDVSTTSDNTASFWDNGWWIRDQSNTRTFVTNGLHTPKRDTIVATLYCSVCDSCAWQEATRYHINYIVFSQRESRTWGVIKHDCGFQGDKHKTLYYRSRQEDYSSPYFSVIYKNRDTIVILEVNDEPIKAIPA